MPTLRLSILLLLVFCPKVFSQNCAPPPIAFNLNRQNIFSPEQEMFLGDAMAERSEKDYRVIDDEAVNAYLQSMGDRISKHLPATGIHFRFVVIDTRDTNAFAMAGGRIFVTRKLISFVRNEDELAGVLGHELGHAVVRHHAIDISRYFKQLLGVTSVGDRRDVFEKYNRFLETYRTKQVKFANDHQDNEQLEADRIGVFAAYAAGYDPNAFTTFWKRFTDAKKKGFFSDLFGSATPADKRLGEMVDALKQIPAACIDKLARTTNDNFENWRRSVISYSGLGSKESVNNLLYRRTLVPLRGDIEHIRFSPNGEYLIAQDNSTITVLLRDPLSILFRIDVEDAFPADFSADSKTLVVYNRNLRIQRWNIAEKTLVHTDEISIRSGYWQTGISPDGKYVAVYRYNGDLVVYDSATSTEIFRQKDFYLPTLSEFYLWRESMYLLDLDEAPVINLKFSPDGRYLLAARKYSETTIAVDLETRKTISIGENIKKLLVTAMDFLGPDKVIGQYRWDIKRSGIFAFPSGTRIDQFELSGDSFTNVGSGDFVTVRPIAGAAVGIYDLKARKYILGNKKSALDVYDKTYAVELRNGEIALYQFGKTEPAATIALPASPFAGLRASSVSADGNWLVVSDRSRGAAWNLNTAERVHHIRNFRGSYITPDAKVYSDFPKLGDTARTIAVMDLKAGSVVPAGFRIAAGNVQQHGQYLVLRRSLNQEKAKADEQKDDEGRSGQKREAYREDEPQTKVDLKETSIELMDVRTGATLWKREFRDETPSYQLDPVQNSMILLWPLASKAAKDIIRSDAALQAAARSMGKADEDWLLQFIDPASGSVKGNFLLETGEGSISPKSLATGGDYLLVADSDNRTLVYSIATGKLVNRFFGDRVALSAESGRIAVENLPGRVMVYEINSGKELNRFSFIKPVTLFQFLNNGERLFVLTADQTAFMFDTARSDKPSPRVGQR